MTDVNWTILKPRYKELLGRDFDNETFLAWFHDWSELSKEVDEAQAWLRLRHHQNLKDEAAQKAHFDFQQGVMAKVKAYERQLQNRLAEIEPGDYPEYKLALRRLKTDADLYHADNANLQAQIEERLSHFGKLQSELSISLSGQNVSLHSAFTERFNPNRTLRQEAFLAVEGAKASVSTEVDTLMLELMALRQRVAENVGLKDFRAYRWLELHRYDYTPEDSLRLHEAIAQEVTPLLAQYYEKKRKALRLDSVCPWDTLVDPQARPPLKPFENVEELELGLEGIFRTIDPVLGAQFAELRNGWLDLENREGKLSMVGYTLPFPKSDRAFIYHSMFSTHADVWIMLHEAGHAFHGMASAQAQDLIWNRDVGLEFCELASQTMELLGLDYLERDKGGFYTATQAAQAKEEQLSRVLRLIATAQTDAFHHWLYPRISEGVTIDELDVKWLELEKLYNPWLDWQGLEDYAKKGWQSPHVIRHPFYALEYKIAMFGAIEIWRSSLENKQETLARYRHALSLGGTLSLPELFESAGASFSFETGHIRALAEFLVGQLNK